jgi:hypothetical protein
MGIPWLPGIDRAHAAELPIYNAFAFSSKAQFAQGIDRNAADASAHGIDDASERRNRLRQRGRIADAIAFLNAAASSGDDDERVTRIAMLERDSGDCSTAARTLEHVKDSKKRSRALSLVNRFCPSSPPAPDDDE